MRGYLPFSSLLAALALCPLWCAPAFKLSPPPGLYCSARRGGEVQTSALGGLLKMSGGSSSTLGDRAPPGLLVVGAGTLGSLVAKLWKQKHAEADVVAETATSSRHETLKKAGVRPTTRAARAEALGSASFPNVVFAVPPSKQDDYADELRQALGLWSGEGVFVFTSSGGVYAEDNGGHVHELSPVSTSPRTQKILEAEQATLQGGGVVLRLAGLYTPDRGPHTFWLARGEVGAPEDGIINLLHYEDAARAAIACIDHVRPDTVPRTLMAADDTPLTRRQICDGAIASPLYRGKYQVPVFKVDPSAPKSLGKVYDTTVSRALLGNWKPLYPSFTEYMAKQHDSVAK